MQALNVGQTTTDTFNYTVKNNGSGNQKVTSAVVSVATDSSSPALAVNSSGTAIPGCQAGWFSVDNTNAAAAADLGPAATETGSAAVSMTNAGTSQDGCKNASPKLTVTVI